MKNQCRTSLSTFTRLGAGMAVAVLIAGCADFSAVKTYADDTSKLGASFTAIADTPVRLCEAQFLMQEQTRDPAFTFRIADVQARAAADCAPLAQDNTRILSLVTLLDSYSATLAALADEKLPSYTAELKGLDAAVDELKDRSGEPIVPPDKAKAVITLGRLVSRLATERVARGEITQLLEQSEAVNATTGALAWYATSVTRPQIDTYQQRSRIAMDAALPRFEKTEPLAVRMYAVTLLGEQERVKKLAAANEALIAALARHREATLALQAKLGQRK
ncbi:hypothetical protein [Pseudoduganella umbonata]|uniref:Uncharacterized protein n=1 Tax=Pseudoduganella umbonata TaxID=864828 RepID=A0A4P8HNL5_9BURK|nr:hypothetical protein [Pseudoduganella umbonata]MBB3220003.1 hypothetical protein [Pseudoduganella umbonata]QCP10010.1 hypothetical protein FCL38_05930 [Pseudoduganella umbonata]